MNDATKTEGAQKKSGLRIPGFAQLQRGAKLAKSAGLEVHAGHGLDFDTARRLAAVPEFVEFNIGHFLMGEALFSGLGPVMREMRKAMDEGRGLP